MSYYPPPTHQDFSVGYGPPPNSGGLYGNEQYNRPIPFPTDQYGQQGFYPPPGPGDYPPMGQYPPTGQYPPPGQYQPPGQYPPPDQYPPPGGQYAPSQPYGQPGYGGEQMPNQPMQGDWTTINQGFPNTPPGLEPLIPLSYLFVKQKVELLEVFTGYETNNKYTIKNDRGDKLFWAMEDSNMCNRMIFGRARPFEIIVVNAQQQEVIRISRALRCSCCLFPCCLQVVEVFAPPGNLLGTIEQDWSILYPRFRVKDVTGSTVLKIKGPFLANPCFGVASFKVLSKDGEIQVGKIKKNWSGVAREIFTDADTFGISFPVDLDVRMKAVVLGAVFLIDAMFFEK